MAASGHRRAPVTGLTPQARVLSDDSSALADLLIARGWEASLAADTAGGVAATALHIAPLDAATTEAMLPVANRLGLQMLTGPDWIVLAGPRARLGAFARPWIQPEPLQALAVAVGMALPAEPASSWHHRAGVLSLEAPVIMGILNLTPDSFSDGGTLESVSGAVAHAERLIAEGASILDLGGESTRPGAEPVPEAEELRRVVPVIEALRAALPGTVLSIDTVKSVVAREACAAGASIVNDVTMGRHDPAMFDVVAAAGAGLVLSHSRGPLAAMAQLPPNEEPGLVGAVADELQAARARAWQAGVTDDRIVLDPGLGFGKTTAGNLALVRQLDALVALGRPVLVGPSRKRFLGEVTGRAIGERDDATAALCALAVAKGARLVRVHAPAAVRDAVALGRAMHQG